MPSVVFTVKGKPHGQGRPRFGNGRAYEAKADKEAKANIKNAAALAMSNRGFLPLVCGEPCAVEITCYDRLPKNAKASIKEQPYTVKPDVDNVAKSVLDAMNGTVYADDSQVVAMNVVKALRTKSMEPGITVRVAWGNTMLQEWEF